MSDPGRQRLPGHRATALGRSPFASVTPAVIAAIAYGALAALVIVTGAGVQGGRWSAVHLFTLGVVTNLVLAFTEHFGRTLTRAPDVPTSWQTPAANVAIVLVLVGIAFDVRAASIAGATGITATVITSYVRLRRLRRHALGARFTWIVRTYERAHGAFIHGAILGLLLGIGGFTGAWYGAARTAHLHVNVLGWAGLTVLATLVFFGPTITRTRIRPGADARAAVALRHGATGLTVGALLLVAVGTGGGPGTAARIAAACALAVYAWAATVVCVDVVDAARRADRSASRAALLAVGGWFILAVWADVAIIAFGRWELLTPLGVAVLIGVLAQVITAVLTYLAPMLRGRTFSARDVLIARLERGATPRTIAFNLAAGTLCLAATPGVALAAPVTRGAWGALVLTVGLTLTAALRPVRRADDGEVRSTIAQRYRQPPP